VSGSWDEIVRLWDAATGAALQILKGHSSGVASVAFSTDGKQVVSAAFYQGMSPLHLATQKGNLAIVTLLVEKGAFKDARDTLHQTPLHYAARKNQREIIRYLLSEGADATVIDVRGKKARDLADLDVQAIFSAPPPVLIRERVQNDTKQGPPSAKRNVLQVAVCEKNEAYLFYCLRNSSKSKQIKHLGFPMSVDDLIYKGKLANVENEYAKDLIKKESAYRWFHLPANNVSFCCRFLVTCVVQANEDKQVTWLMV
jgi:hypothetical protein